MLPAAHLRQKFVRPLLTNSCPCCGRPAGEDRNDVVTRTYLKIAEGCRSAISVE